MEDNWDKTDIRYSAEAHTYCSAQPSVFSHIELNVYVSTFGYSNSSIKCFLCAAVVAVSYLLSYDKKNVTLHGVDMVLWMSLFLSVVMH